MALDMLEALGPATGVVQTGTGLVQGAGEMLMQLLNLGRRGEIASNIEQASQEAAQNFGTDARSVIRNSTNTLRQSSKDANKGFSDIANTLKQGRKDALNQWQGIVPQAQAAGSDIMSKRDQALAEMKNKLNTADSAADSNVDEVKQFGMDSLARIKESNDNAFDTMAARADAVVSGIRTNMTERAGATVGGIRQAAEQEAEKTAMQMRLAGHSEAEILRETNLIRDRGVSTAATTWGQAFTAMSDQIASAGVAGNNMLGTLASNLNGAYSGAETNLVNAVADSLKKSLDVKVASATAYDAAAQARGELAKGIMDSVTGTMEFVSGKTSEIIGSEASAQAANQQNRILYNKGVTDQMLALDNMRINISQYAADTVLNGSYQAAGMRAGFMWQMPNMVGLTGSGMQMIQNSAASMTQPVPDDTKGFGFTLPVIGGGVQT